VFIEIHAGATADIPPEIQIFSGMAYPGCKSGPHLHRKFRYAFLRGQGYCTNGRDTNHKN